MTIIHIIIIVISLLSAKEFLGTGITKCPIGYHVSLCAKEQVCDIRCDPRFTPANPFYKFTEDDL